MRVAADGAPCCLRARLVSRCLRCVQVTLLSAERRLRCQIKRSFNRTYMYGLWQSDCSAYQDSVFVCTRALISCSPGTRRELPHLAKHAHARCWRCTGLVPCRDTSARHHSRRRVGQVQWAASGSFRPYRMRLAWAWHAISIIRVAHRDTPGAAAFPNKLRCLQTERSTRSAAQDERRHPIKSIIFESVMPAPPPAAGVFRVSNTAHQGKTTHAMWPYQLFAHVCGC